MATDQLLSIFDELDNDTEKLIQITETYGAKKVATEIHKKIKEAQKILEEHSDTLKKQN